MTQDLVRAQTVEEAGAWIRQRAETGGRIRIAGSNSLPLTAFAEDSRNVDTLATTRLNKLVEHAVGDMTVIVQAGMTLESLQKQLAWQNQWLPVDPPLIARDGKLPGHRTIGGLIASNSLGPLRFGCGDWRLFIMGMKWLDAAGRIIKGGGRTVKNVAGYSSPRMMIGSCGSLGMIAEVTLRTFARPADERCVVFYCLGPAKAEELLAALQVTATVPAYLQVIGGRTFAANPLELPIPREGALVVVAGFLGRPEVCAAQAQIVRGMDAAKELEAITQPAAQSGRLRLWMTSEPALELGRPGVGFRIHGQSSRAANVVDAIEAAARAAGGEPWVISEAGNGVVRGVMPGLTEQQLREIAGAGASILWTQGVISRPRGHVLANRIKRELDPTGVFGEVPQ